MLADLGDSKGPAVKALQLHVNEEFGSSFYDACKDVKFAATNGLAMEFMSVYQTLRVALSYASPSANHLTGSILYSVAGAPKTGCHF